MRNGKIIKLELYSQENFSLFGRDRHTTTIIIMRNTMNIGTLRKYLPCAEYLTCGFLCINNVSFKEFIVGFCWLPFGPGTIKWFIDCLIIEETNPIPTLINWDFILIKLVFNSSIGFLTYESPLHLLLFPV